MGQDQKMNENLSAHMCTEKNITALMCTQIACIELTISKWVHLWKYLLYSPRYEHMCRPYFIRKWHIFTFFAEKVTFKRDFQYKPRIFVLKLFDLHSAFQNGCMFGNIFYTHRVMNICAGLIFFQKMVHFHILY